MTYYISHSVLVFEVSPVGFVSVAVIRHIASCSKATNIPESPTVACTRTSGLSQTYTRSKGLIAAHHPLRARPWGWHLNSGDLAWCQCPLIWQVDTDATHIPAAVPEWQQSKIIYEKICRRQVGFPKICEVKPDHEVCTRRNILHEFVDLLCPRTQNPWYMADACSTYVVLDSGCFIDKPIRPQCHVDGPDHLDGQTRSVKF